MVICSKATLHQELKMANTKFCPLFKTIVYCQKGVKWSLWNGKESLFIPEAVFLKSCRKVDFAVYSFMFGLCSEIAV